MDSPRDLPLFVQRETSFVQRETPFVKGRHYLLLRALFALLHTKLLLKRGSKRKEFAPLGNKGFTLKGKNSNEYTQHPF